MSEADMSSAYEQASSWLTWLYGDDFAGNVWIGGHANWRGARFADVASAARYATGMDQAGVIGAGVYHRLTTMNDAAEKRGTDQDSVMLPAVMLDLDLRGPGHVATTYPETVDDLRAVLADAGLPEPSAWVHSGGGRYPCWKLDKPLHLAFGPETFALGQDLLRLIQATVREAASARGWKLDNTSDLARVYRIPGTTNRKAADPAEYVMATWETGSGLTYPLADLTPERAAQPVPAPASAPASCQSSLFSGDDGYSPAYAGVGARAFTLADAMAFVRPALDALATAVDGEINVRLNEAACVLAHFGPEFWDESAADGQIEKALASTAYDGRTWKAADTVVSARRAMAGDWRATLLPAAHEMYSAPVDAVDAVDALIAEMVSVSELAARPSPRFLIQGLLQFDSESWLIGAPGSKKSFVAFDMAARVSRGEQWQGRRTNPADVVMIVAEGAGGAGKRGRAWEKAYGAIEGVRVLPRPVQAIDVGAWRVLVEACGRIGDGARERGRGLMVIVDTQARVTVGLDENSAKEMGIYIEAVRAIRERTGACVLSVHHTGRAGGDARGSSAIDGAQTTELKVTSASGAAEGRLFSEKQKDMEPAPPIDLRFKSVFLGMDDDGEPITSLILVEPGAWDDAVIDGKEIDRASGEPEDPFGERTNLDPWIIARVPRASLQWWIVQALVDTTETLGLTKAEVRAIVEGKRGKIDNSPWGRAWQKVTAEGGQWSDVVVSAGGQRWTVDRVAVVTEGEN